MINPKIIEIIKNNGFNVDNVLNYLLSLHYNINPNYIPELVKKQANISGIINRDFNKGTIHWIVPLFTSVTTPQTTSKQVVVEKPWIWVTEEYRKMFIEIRKDAGGDKQGCVNKMQRFFAENPEIRKDDVLKATRLYLDKFSSGTENPKFLQQANYFIFKGTKGQNDYQSRLSQYIEMLVNETGKPSNRLGRGLL